MLLPPTVVIVVVQRVVADESSLIAALVARVRALPLPPHAVFSSVHGLRTILLFAPYIAKLLSLSRRAEGCRAHLGWERPGSYAGMEVMHAIRKGQLVTTGTMSQTPAEQFYALVA